MVFCVEFDLRQSVYFWMQDGSAALKQILKIGVEDTPGAEQANKKSYGRQVSIQELFDGELMHAAEHYLLIFFKFCYLPEHYPIVVV